MDKLKIIIDTLSNEDVREFNAFVKRQKKSRNRKDLELFELLRKKHKRLPRPKEMVALIYPETQNQVAYHALRKRLMKHLTDFIVLKRMEEDNSATSSVMGMISLSLYLFDMGQTQLAWQFLNKAENTAQAGEHFDLLNNIYNIQITHADAHNAGLLQEVIAKWKANKTHAEEDERANVASSVIKGELNRIRLQGRDFDFDSVIQQVLIDYKLTEAVSKRPRLFHSMMSIARSAVLVKKDYHAFAPFLEKQYEQFLRQRGFAQSQLYYQLNLLYMLAHVFYRSKKFEHSIMYLDQLHRLITSHKKTYFSLFYPKYVLLLAANLAFAGKSSQAITLLTEALTNHKTSPFSEKDEMNAWLNLGLYHFHLGHMEQVVACSLRLHKSDQFYEKRMGKEWVIKKNLCEMMFQYDFGNIDLAFNKMRAIERNYVNVFTQQKYQNARKFLKLIKAFFDQPNLVSKAEFIEKVDASLEFLPFEEEDLQAVSFYAWLKSKMMKCSYYEALLHLTHEG